MGVLFSWWDSPTTNPQRVVVASRAKGAKVLPSGVGQKVDYDAEGAALMRRMSSSSDRLVMGVLSAVLGDPSTSSQGSHAYHDVDVLWQHPETGGLLYVGNDRAARSDAYLTDLKVSSIVNCTRPSKYGALDDYHKGTGRYNYYDIPVGHWVEYCLRNASGAELVKEEDRFEATLRFLVPAFIFALRALKQGRNVLVHCLAGAHRAGTMGILLLMHLQGLSVEDATGLAQRLRPVIDPISDFPRLLGLFEKAARWRARLAGVAHGPAWNLPLTAAQHSFDNMQCPPSSSSPQQAFASYGARLNRSKSMTAGSAAAVLEAMASLQHQQQIQFHDLHEKFVPPSSSRRPSNAGAPSTETPSLNRSGSFSAKTPRQTPRRKSQDPDSFPAAATNTNTVANTSCNTSSTAISVSTVAPASAFSAAYQSDVVGRGSPEHTAHLREKKKPDAKSSTGGLLRDSRRYSLG